MSVLGFEFKYMDVSYTYLDHLSSGENLAGCADFVTSPSAIFFSVYMRFPFPSSVYMRCILATENDVYIGSECAWSL